MEQTRRRAVLELRQRMLSFVKEERRVKLVLTAAIPDVRELGSDLPSHERLGRSDPSSRTSGIAARKTGSTRPFSFTNDSILWRNSSKRLALLADLYHLSHAKVQFPRASRTEQPTTTPKKHDKIHTEQKNAFPPLRATRTK